MVVPFWESLGLAILALIAVVRLGLAEPSDAPTGWKDVETLGAPTRYFVDVEQCRFGTTDVRDPAFYPIPRHLVTRKIVTFEESAPARVAPVWNTHNIGPALGQHGHAPTNRRERHAQQEDPPSAAQHARRNLPGVPGCGTLRAGSFQALGTLCATASNDWN